MLLTCLFGYVAISIMIAHVLTRPNQRKSNLDPKLVCKDVVPWSTRTADGLTLRGWHFPTGAHRRLIVLVHGMGGSLNEMAAIGHDLHAKGYDVLLFDLRGHGSSDPSRLTMGAREREDLRSVLAWALKEGYAEDRIGWLGHSMGGSTLLMEAEQNPKFRAVVIDSAYGNLPELLDRQLTEHSHLPKIFNPGILLAARFVFGVRTDNLIPIESAGRWGHRPLLLIHGTLDSIVPIAQAQKIVSAVGSTCETMILPDVEHVGAFNAARTQYIETVDHFFDRLLAR
jgi:fermentation-respiration switch protein FrsA (DUF1100 family)